MDPDVNQLLALLAAHKWVALAALVIGLLVRLMKDDTLVAWFPIAVPPRWRPLLALGLGICSGILQQLTTSAGWPEAIVGGIVSAVTAIGGHAVVVDALRGGRDVGVAKPGGVMPPTVAAVFVFAVILGTTSTLSGCAALPVLIQVADAVAIAAPYAAQVVDDVDRALAEYFVTHPDPARQAMLQGKLEAAKLAAIGLGKLAETGKEVSQRDYLDALATFSQAWSALYTAVQELEGVQVVPPAMGGMMRAKPGVKTIVMPPPSTFIKHGA